MIKISDLSRLAGIWFSQTETTETEELWQSPKAGMMLGLNRTVSRNGNTAFEFLRIYENENMVYYAACPNGRFTTIFELVEHSNNQLVFENPENDFPQKIIYTFLGSEKLKARIEGKRHNKVKSLEWIFKKVDR